MEERALSAPLPLSICTRSMGRLVFVGAAATAQVATGRTFGSLLYAAGGVLVSSAAEPDRCTAMSGELHCVMEAGHEGDHRAVDPRRYIDYRFRLATDSEGLRSGLSGQPAGSQANPSDAAEGRKLIVGKVATGEYPPQQPGTVDLSAATDAARFEEPSKDEQAASAVRDQGAESPLTTPGGSSDAPLAAVAHDRETLRFIGSEAAWCAKGLAWWIIAPLRRLPLCRLGWHEWCACCSPHNCVRCGKQGPE